MIIRWVDDMSYALQQNELKPGITDYAHEIEQIPWVYQSTVLKKQVKSVEFITLTAVSSLLKENLKNT